MNDIKARLSVVRELLSELGGRVSVIKESFSDSTGVEEMLAEIESFEQVYLEARERLANPIFSIATIGTTSSGKSTLVNSLVGRKLAPIDSKETSAGVLTIRHNSQRRLEIENTRGAQWHTGEWIDLSDEDIYDKIRDEVMFPYQKTREGAAEVGDGKVPESPEVEAPRVLIESRILPIDDPDCLNLPSGVGLEFVDLPGLKSSQDDNSLQVIKQRINRSFNLIVLDYSQVDEKTRDKLYEQLQDIVNVVGKRADLMILILNRVDRRTDNDDEVSTLVKRLQDEIQQRLKLTERPEIIPFCGLALFYAQCAWGPRGLDSEVFDALISDEQRLKFLKSLFRDCSGFIGDNIGGDRELRGIFRSIEDRLWDNHPVSNDEVRMILEHVLEWSRGTVLWQAMRTRVQNSFSELVLLPALVGVFTQFDSMLNNLRVVAETRKVKKLGDIARLISELEASRSRLEKELNQLTRGFTAGIEEAVDDLTVTEASKAQARQAQMEQWGKMSGILQNIAELDEIASDVGKDLSIRIIKPIIATLKSSGSVYELRDEIAELVQRGNAEFLSAKYDMLRSRLAKGFSRNESENFTKKYRSDDNSSEVKEMDDDVIVLNNFCYAVQTVLADRASRLMQIQVSNFEENLQNIINELIYEMSVFCKKELPDLNLHDAVFANFWSRTSIETILLPENLFYFPPLSSTVVFEKNLVGTKEVKKNRRIFWFFSWNYTVEEDIFEDIQYKTIEIPGYEEMEKLWGDSISEGKKVALKKLKDIILLQIEEIKICFISSIEKAMSLAKLSLDQQRDVLEGNRVAEKVHWNNIENQLIAAEGIKNTLHSISRGGDAHEAVSIVETPDSLTQVVEDTVLPPILPDPSAEPLESS